MEPGLGKLFIGGISWDTSEERLRDYFVNFGEVVEAVIMKDRITGRARGFGFVVFADPAVAERVVMEKHTIDGRLVEAKKAVPRGDHHLLNINSSKNSSSSIPGSPGAAPTRKIFVGGLAPSVTERDFKNYFDQFGIVTDVVVMYDHNTQRPRGFGFVTYDSEDAVDKVLVRTFHELNGKLVEVKRAVPRELSPGPTVRSPLGNYNYGLQRITGYAIGNGQGYGPSSNGAYSMDGRFVPTTTNRSRYSPLSLASYGMGMDFEHCLNSSYGGNNYSNGISYGHGTNSLYNGNISRYHDPIGFDGGNGDGTRPPLASNSSNFWVNGSLNYRSETASSTNLHGSGGGNIAGIGNGRPNWGNFAAYILDEVGSNPSRFGRESLGYGNAENYGPAESSYGSRNSRSRDLDSPLNGLDEDAYINLYGSNTVYGDPTWRTDSSGIDGSIQFGFGLRNAIAAANKSSADRTSVADRQSQRGIAA